MYAFLRRNNHLLEDVCSDELLHALSSMPHLSMSFVISPKINTSWNLSPSDLPTPQLTYPTRPNSFPSPCRLLLHHSSNRPLCNSPHVLCLSFHLLLHPYPAPRPVSFSSSRPNQAQYQHDPVPVFLPLSHTLHASYPYVPQI